ncbi:MAG: DJ-1/PfpI family protein [Parvularculaceae bacterium]
MQIGFLIFPRMTQLDAMGPGQILSQLPGAQMHYIWKTRDPVPTDSGYSLLPTTAMTDAPQLDVICIPGGPGQFEIMDDEAVLEFVSRQGEKAKYVTSVCTGSLLLGRAGLLNGYEAGCHWAFRELLKEFGAIPVNKRVVRDRNRLTGGGVTAGIDFGLTLAAELAGEPFARAMELAFEYNPEPPFKCGTPELAGSELEGVVRDQIAESFPAL